MLIGRSFAHAFLTNHPSYNDGNPKRRYTRGEMLGFVEFSLADILGKKDVVLKIRGPNMLDRPTDPRDALNTSSGFNTVHGGIHTGPAPKLTPAVDVFKFPVPVGPDGLQLACTEVMAESNYFLTVPNQLLRIFVAEDKTKARHLENLKDLSGRMQKAHEAAFIGNAMRVGAYLQQVAFIDSYSGPCFKKSTQKNSEELSMFACNLHTQTLDVSTVRASKGSYEPTQVKPAQQYCIVSHGCFAAHPLGHKKGGLRSMLKSSAEARNWAVPCQKIYEARRQILELQDQMLQCSERISIFLSMNISSPEIRAELHAATTQFATTLAGLDKLLKFDESVNEAFQQAQKGAASMLAGMSQATLCSDLEESYKRMIVSWTHLQAQLDGGGAAAQTQTAIETDVREVQLNLGVCVEQFKGMVALAVDCLLLYELQWAPVDGTAEGILHRRDVAFSQALTTLATVFIERLKTKITGQTKADRDQIFEPMVKLGYLVQFESLLSTQGHEIAMIEDMAVAVEDLSNVRIRLTPTSESRKAFDLKVTGQRYAFKLDVAVDPMMLDRLPAGMQHRDGIRVVPIMFSQGVNEMQVMARNVGNTDLQEQLCEEALVKMSAYARQFKAFAQEKRYHQRTIQGIDGLLGELDTLVKKKKGIDNLSILQKAEMLTRKMNGGRCTCCKSGKDRTGMSVTLEECSVMMEHHNMASNGTILNGILDFIRSKGVRLNNVLKNTGEPKYAFNKLQVMALPKLLRPPADAIGASVT